MPQQPNPAEAKVAARLVAAGRPTREAAAVLGVSTKHVKRTLDRALRAVEDQAGRDLAEARTLRAALRTGGGNAR